MGGNTPSESTLVARKWLKLHPNKTFKHFDKEYPGLCTSQNFYNTKHLLRKRGEIPGGKVSITPTKKEGGGYAHDETTGETRTKNLTQNDAGYTEVVGPGHPKYPLNSSSYSTQALNSGTSDAAVILECAVKVWISKEAGIVQLDTIIQKMVQNYRLVQKLISKRRS